jgi:hypothetical protein
MSSQTHRLRLRSGCAGLGLSRGWQEENRANVATGLARQGYFNCIPERARAGVRS